MSKTIIYKVTVKIQPIFNPLVNDKSRKTVNENTGRRINNKASMFIDYYKTNYGKNPVINVDIHNQTEILSHKDDRPIYIIVTYSDNFVLQESPL